MAIYRFTIDSTRATVARYPGAHDIVMDAQTGQAAALCPHHEEQVCQGAFSYAPVIREALERMGAEPIFLRTEHVDEILMSLRSSKGDGPATRDQLELAQRIEWDRSK